MIHRFWGTYFGLVLIFFWLHYPLNSNMFYIMYNLVIDNQSETIIIYDLWCLKCTYIIFMVFRFFVVCVCVLSPFVALLFFPQFFNTIGISSRLSLFFCKLFLQFLHLFIIQTNSFFMWCKFLFSCYNLLLQLLRLWNIRINLYCTSRTLV